MALKLITAPATTPVSVTEAKRHSEIDRTDRDAQIELFIKSSTAHVEKFLGRALIDQTWELTLDSFPDSEIMIPLPPLLEVVSVIYDDGSGDEQTLPDDEYTVDLASEPGWVVPTDDWPATFDAINAVRIRFRAGYLNTNSPQAANVPEDIKAAILLTFGTLWENRETIILGESAVLLPWAAEQLLCFHKIRLGMA